MLDSELAVETARRVGVGVGIYRPDGRFAWVNETYASMLGYDQEDLIETPIWEVNPEFRPESMQDYWASLSKGETRFYEGRHRRADGTTFPVEMVVTHIVVDGEEYHVGTIKDISRRKEKELELERSDYILDASPDAVYHVDADDIIRMVNEAAVEMTGYDRNELIGESITKLLPPDDFERITHEVNAIQQQPASHKGTFEVEVVRADGTVITCENHLALLPPPGEDSGSVGILRDITERKQLEEQLRQRALYDELTELPNRVLFMDRLRTAFERYRENSNALFSVVYLDLDRFKVINESMGHHLGDKLLKAVARRLEDRLPSSDTVARLGGDDFALLLEDVADPQEALSRAETLSRAVEEPFRLEGENIFTRASLGVVLPSAGEYENPDALLRDAEIAMHRSKSENQRYTLFDPEMHRETREEMELEMDLQRSIEHGELEVHYQPILRIDDQGLLGFEALIRWNHPERGYLSPGVFLPLAKKTGFMSDIDTWVLEQACRDLKQWQENTSTSNDIFVSVNCSPLQLSDPAFADHVVNTLEKTDLSPSSLYLEMTESAVVANPEQASSVIGHLQEEGVHIVVDDFGTGYSSLSYLSSLPIDMLKIDRSFVFQLESENGDEKSQRIVRAIMNLADGLRTDVIAEGIETEEQTETLLAMDCQFGQGFYYSKPMQAHLVQEFIHSL